MTDGAAFADPILVEVTRGPLVESVHRGAAVLCDADGRVVRACGDIDRPVYPRSAAKPLQALALVASGAADAYGLTDEHLALAAGSHTGTDRHVALVGSWLAHLGLDETALVCGAARPEDPASRDALLRAGVAASALHHGCSGKHAGFLTVARHLGAPVAGYAKADHPVQRLVIDAMRRIADWTGPALCGRDGCGVPTWGLPSLSLACAMARMADPGTLDAATGAAARRIASAMARHPDLVAGPGLFDSEFVADHPEVVVKTGAEGVVCGFLPGRGLGFAVKIDDGALRAAWVAAVDLLARAGVLTAEPAARWREPPVLDNVGGVVGSIRSVV